MTLEAVIQASACNLKQTYLALGRAAARSKVWREDGFDACTGELDHPICNFAVDLKLDRERAFRLAEIAIDRSCFHVYGLPTDEPAQRTALLEAAGFARNYSLVKMVAPPGATSPSGMLTRATTLHDRHQIASFMVEQFFAKHVPLFRRQIAETTARATSLELLGYRKDGQLLGTAMICLHGGVAGVYNLCVDAGLRGLGIGTAILREALAVCAERKLPACLQCDPKLEAWYTKSTFIRVGELEIFSLPRPGGFVIMQQA